MKNAKPGGDDQFHVSQAEIPRTRRPFKAQGEGSPERPHDSGLPRRTHDEEREHDKQKQIARHRDGFVARTAALEGVAKASHAIEYDGGDRDGQGEARRLQRKQADHSDRGVCDAEFTHDRQRLVAAQAKSLSP